MLLQLLQRLLAQPGRQTQFGKLVHFKPKQRHDWASDYQYTAVIGSFHRSYMLLLMLSNKKCSQKPVRVGDRWSQGLNIRGLSQLPLVVIMVDAPITHDELWKQVFHCRPTICDIMVAICDICIFIPGNCFISVFIVFYCRWSYFMFCFPT